MYNKIYNKIMFSEMFDKMIFNAKIDFSRDAFALAKRNHLQKCMEGAEAFYQSSSYGNFDGVFLRIRGGTLQVKCSLHKLFYKDTCGCLDNSRMFTVSNALEMIGALFERIGIERESAKVTYFEIGLNIPLSRDPLEYIGMVLSAGGENGKEMFNDANFQKNRQKTTEKSRNIKKVLKIYDKGFEARSKGKHVEGNILRVETIYRRQSLPLPVLFSGEYIGKLTGRFYRDWQSLEFPRRLCFDKGIKASQAEKARCLLSLGREEYLRRSREAFLLGECSKKQWETVRVFVRNWDSLKSRFYQLPDGRETEYRRELERMYRIATL